MIKGILTTNQAIEFVKNRTGVELSRDGIIYWIKTYDIGYKMSHTRWMIWEKKLLEVVKKKEKRHARYKNKS